MNSIEKRAEKYALDKCGGKIQEGTKGMIYSGAYNEYVKIANEQKEIDIERAVDYMKELMWEKSINSGMDKDRFINSFRNIMKGE